MGYVKESTLLKIAILGSILGILSLFAISPLTEIEQSTIPDLKETGHVRLRGIIGNVRTTNTTTQFTLLQKNSIPGVVFDHLDLRPGDEVEITGTVETRKGKKQVIVREVKSLD